MTFKEEFLILIDWDDWSIGSLVIGGLALAVIITGAVIEPAVWIGLLGGVAWTLILLLLKTALIWAELRYASKLDTPIDMTEASEKLRIEHPVTFIISKLSVLIYWAFVLIASVMFILNATGL